MENYNEAVKFAKEIIEEDEKLQEKHTKSGSARQRKNLNEIKKLVTGAKNELLAKDKGE